MTNRAKIQKNRNKFHKKFTENLIKDNAKKIPVIGSMFTAVEDVKIEKNNAQLNKKINKIDKNVSLLSSAFGDIAPLISPKRSMKKLDVTLNFLDDITQNDPDFDIHIEHDSKRGRVFHITPKKEPLEITGTLNVSKEKMGGC